MDKTLNILLVLAVILTGCLDDSEQVTGHCYLVSGLYLVSGDHWQEIGYVSDVFDTYNTDPDLEYFYEKNPSAKQLLEYQNQGYRVVVGYPTNGLGGYHYRPMEWHENINPDSVFVAGYFNEVKNEK